MNQASSRCGRIRCPRGSRGAKFGIFIHWGVFSIPAWAPTSGTMFDQQDPFRNTPYTEWYLNSLALDGSPVQAHHRDTYGDDYPYDAFAPQFKEAIRGWDPTIWADLFAAAGARYVVLVTKHHDGFLLWPSAHPNPFKEGWHSDRDLVGELGDAVRGSGPDATACTTPADSTGRSAARASTRSGRWSRRSRRATSTRATPTRTGAS